MDNKNFDRRKFLAAISMGTGYLMFSSPFTACSRAANSTDPFQLVKLGDSGLKTTLLGMGTGVHGNKRSSNLTRQDHNKSLAAIKHAYDMGIRLFDCADTYGIHPLMSEALKTIPRDEITLISKIWEREGGIPEDERPDADVVVERFRKELNTDYIDLVQMHCMVDEDWTDTYKRQMDILSDQKAKGIIKAHGVSVHTLEAMEAALVSDWVDVIHVRINPYGIAMDRPDPEEVITVINKLHDSGKGVIGMKLIGGGKYVDDGEKIDNALKFVIGMSSVDMIIVGFESSEQIDDYSSRLKKALGVLSSA